jgi:DNA-binding SARP family transcriptional activator
MGAGNAFGPAGIGGHIRRERHAAGLTQKEIAKRASVSLGAVRDLEQGRVTQPRSDSIRRLAYGLGLSADHTDEIVRLCGAMRQRDGASPAKYFPFEGTLCVDVLGPLRVTRSGKAIDIGAPAQRAVFGLLALRANDPVGRETIIDALWPDDPPTNANKIVSMYIGRLRSSVGECLDRERAGLAFRLRLATSSLDAFAFNETVLRARGELNPQAACTAYEAALDLWHGSPVSDIPTLRELPEAVALAESRRTVTNEYAAMALRAARHERALPVLRREAARHPLDELAHAWLILALTAAGRRAEALQVYHVIRPRLKEQLNVQPCAELREAHRTALGQIAPG